MSCSNPFYMKDVRDWRDRLVPIPCGRCNCCRADRISLWERRAKYEFNHTPASAFVTFTYDDEHLPISVISGSPHQTLQRIHLHKFIDTLRHRIAKGQKIKHSIQGCSRDFAYLACGEYGDRFGRPHYHVLFFGIDFHTCRTMLMESWPYGSIEVDPIKAGAIRYVLKYMTKQVYNDYLDREYYDYGINPPFVTFSRGLGMQYFYDHQKDIAEYGAVRDGQLYLSVPSYVKQMFVPMDIDKAVERSERVSRSMFHQWNISGRMFGSVKSARYERVKNRENALYSRSLNRLTLAQTQYTRYNNSGSNAMELEHTILTRCRR